MNLPEERVRRSKKPDRIPDVIPMESGQARQAGQVLRKDNLVFALISLEYPAWGCL